MLPCVWVRPGGIIDVGPHSGRYGSWAIWFFMHTRCEGLLMPKAVNVRCGLLQVVHLYFTLMPIIQLELLDLYVASRPGW